MDKNIGTKLQNLTVGIIDKKFGPKYYCCNLNYDPGQTTLTGGIVLTKPSIDSLAENLAKNLVMDDVDWSKKTSDRSFLLNKGHEFWGDESRPFLHEELGYLNRKITEYFTKL